MESVQTAISSLQQQVSQVGSEVRSSYTNFEEGSTIQKQKILSTLRSGTRYLQEALSDEFSPRLLGDGSAQSQALVKVETQSLMIRNSFTELAKHAEALLQTARDCQQHTTKLEVRISLLNQEVLAVSKIADRSAEKASEDAQVKGKLLKELEDSLQGLNSEISSLEAKIEDGKDDRNILRGVRVAVWGAAAFFPIAVVPGLILEGIAHDIGKDRKKIEEKREVKTAEVSSARQVVKSMRSDKKAAEGVARTAHSMSQRCEDLTKEVRKWKAVATKQIRYYQQVVNRASDFSIWTDDIEAQIQWMDASSMQGFRVGVENLIESFPRDVNREARLICQPLLQILDSR